VFWLTGTNEILNVRVPNDLIIELDSLVKKRVFKSRSEAIREFAREYVQEQESLQTKNAKVSGRGGGRW
jgi:metal-responsive CopG/Arc/MetJ family transcriptional regulator